MISERKLTRFKIKLENLLIAQPFENLRLCHENVKNRKPFENFA